MIFLRLYLEFFRTGLFSVGGGLATIPFLRDMGVRTGWFTDEVLTTMIAVSESTPGPIGVNMATYVGFTVGGAAGAVIATLGLLSPSIVIVLIIARFLRQFRNSKVVDGVFYGLRPASVALITAAGLSVAANVLTLPGGSIHWCALALCAVLFVLMQVGPLKKIHPVAFIAASAVLGVLLQL